MLGSPVINNFDYESLIHVVFKSIFRVYKTLKYNSCMAIILPTDRICFNLGMFLWLFLLWAHLRCYRNVLLKQI